MPSGQIIGVVSNGNLMVLEPSVGGYKDGTTPVFIAKTPFSSSGSDRGFIIEEQGYTFISVGSRIYRILSTDDPGVAENWVLVGSPGETVFAIARKDGGLRSFMRTGVIRDHLTAFDTKPSNTATTPTVGATTSVGSGQSLYQVNSMVRLGSGRIIGAVSAYVGMLHSTYSDDEGVTWHLTSHRIPSLLDTRYANNACVDGGDRGIFVFGAANSIFWSVDGTSWVRLPNAIDEVATQNITAATALPNGKGILYWNLNGVHRIGPPGFENWFPTLGAFTPGELRSTVHPVTGLPWEPAQAAQIEFGLRVSS